MYDFKTLSAYDFENLVRDLLQHRLNIILESFKPGKDEGVDLRHAAAKNGSLIVQCKHYAESGYRSLLATLKKELPKVHRLAPARYCVATSVPLSIANKREIKKVFSPFCQCYSDIFGLEDLNNFLGLYPEIERHHYKLWLTSSTVLERIAHSDVYNQTAALVEAIQQKARLYVQNESFFDALTILKEHKYCIISGIPGIGKSFLAEILLLEHIRQGFEPIVIRSHISEAFRLLKGGRRQVFYYDDFLGQTGWEDKLEKNEEQTILDFISYVRRHEHAAFILTTREYILQQARNVYEKLHAANFDHAKCIINLASYTRRNRAHILFNHIFFSELPADYRRLLARKEHLLKVVDHKNYSPRIVEWMSGVNNLRNCSPKEYPTLFLSTLDDPTVLWLHAYRNHLTPVARSMLLVLFSFQGGVDLGDLREAFEAFRLQEVKRYGVARAVNEFDVALDELEGSFVRCERDGKALVVSFHNPSVRDFLEKHLASNVDKADILCESLVFYDQFRGVFTPQATRHQLYSIRLGDGVADEAIKSAVLRTLSRTAKRHALRTEADGSVTVLNIVTTTSETNAAHALRMATDLPRRQATAIAGEVLKQEERRLTKGKAILGDVHKVLAAAKGIREITPMWDTLVRATCKAFEDIEEYEELEQIIALKDFLNVAPDDIPSELVQRVRSTLGERGDEIFDWDISQADDENILDELAVTATEFERTFGISLDKIHKQIEEQREEVRTRFDETPDDWYDRDRPESPDADDTEIVVMFGSMFE